MNQSTPMIELYMYSLNQEFPVDKGHGTFLKGGPIDEPGEALIPVPASEVLAERPDLPPDWKGQWLRNNPWAFKSPPGDWVKKNPVLDTKLERDPDSDPLLRCYIRSEDFGAVLFEPISDRVFLLNQPGYKLMKALLQYYKDGSTDLTQYSSSSYTSGDVSNFIEYLKNFYLWTK